MVMLGMGFAIVEGPKRWGKQTNARTCYTFRVGSKSISIEQAALDRLVAHPRLGEGLTHDILSVLPLTPSMGEVLNTLAEKLPLSDKAADAILDHVVAQRARAKELSSKKHAS